MKTTLLAAAIVALLPIAPANAAGQTGSFDTLDANKDGRISMPEASADPKLVEGFSKADTNGDGYLDKPEYDSRTAPPQK